MPEKKEKMKILYASFEAVPFVKLGGLGDVAGTLPMSIAAHKCDVRVILPYHGLIKKEERSRLTHQGDYEVEFMGENVPFSLYQVKMRGVIFYLVKNDKYFDRKQAYGEKDDLERFVFFSRAILASIGNMGSFIPQILHANDWHTAMANVYLHEDFEEKLGQYNIKTVYTIHNLLYQGKYQYEKVKDILNLKGRSAVAKVMHKGKVNLMKAGIAVSDCVTTPSPSYAKEILTFAYGEGLENVLKKREKETFGILNGIDYVDFNPAWDTNIKVHFTKDLIERRLGDKIDLQKKFKLKVDPNMLLTCVACRFYEQKGISLIMEAVPKIVKNNAQILFLGDGDEKYKKQIKQFEKKYKGQVASHLQFDPLLPHNLYAGADLLLMPSKFEPCGVAQMMAMHYGALPLVRSTGGLRDTVHNYEPKSLVCNGFVFKNYNVKEFEKALDTVFHVWENDRKNWTRMQKRAMDKDFSWKESGRKYCVLYEGLINDKLDTVNQSFDEYAIAHAQQRAKDAAAKAARHAADRAEIAEKELAKEKPASKKRSKSKQSYSDEEFVDIREILSNANENMTEFSIEDTSQESSKKTKKKKSEKQKKKAKVSEKKSKIAAAKSSRKNSKVTVFQTRKIKRLNNRAAKLESKIQIAEARYNLKMAKKEAKQKIKEAKKSKRK